MGGGAPVNVAADGLFRCPPWDVRTGRDSGRARPAHTMGHNELTIADRDITNLIVPVGEGLPVTGRVELSGSAATPTTEILEKSRVLLGPVDISMQMFATIGCGVRWDMARHLRRVGDSPSPAYRQVVAVWPSPCRTHRGAPSSGLRPYGPPSAQVTTARYFTSTVSGNWAYQPNQNARNAATLGRAGPDDGFTGVSASSVTRQDRPC